MAQVQLPWVAKPGDKPKKPVPKSEWGPPGWRWLHLEAINYPAAPDEKLKMAMFLRFWAFIQSLPCAECHSHAMEYIRAYPPDFSGSKGFQKWVWRFHNAVNHRLGKPLMSSEKYQDTYKEEIEESFKRSYWKYV